jgi:hypothetical protein
LSYIVIRKLYDRWWCAGSRVPPCLGVLERAACLKVTCDQWQLIFTFMPSSAERAPGTDRPAFRAHGRMRRVVPISELEELEITKPCMKRFIESTKNRFSAMHANLRRY